MKYLRTYLILLITLSISFLAFPVTQKAFAATQTTCSVTFDWGNYLSHPYLKAGPPYQIQLNTNFTSTSTNNTSHTFQDVAGGRFYTLTVCDKNSPISDYFYDCYSTGPVEPLCITTTDIPPCGSNLTCNALSDPNGSCSEGWNKCLSDKGFGGAAKVNGKSAVCCNSQQYSYIAGVCSLTTNGAFTDPQCQNRSATPTATPSPTPQCTGTPHLDLSPTTVTRGETFTATITGLSNCYGRAGIYEGNSGWSCQLNGTGCSFTHNIQTSLGTHTFEAQIYQDPNSARVTKSNSVTFTVVAPPTPLKWTRVNVCSATNNITSSFNCGDKNCSSNQTCVGTTFDNSTYCLQKNAGINGSYCGTPNKTPNNDACSSGYCAKGNTFDFECQDKTVANTCSGTPHLDISPNTINEGGIFSIRVTGLANCGSTTIKDAFVYIGATNTGWPCNLNEDGTGCGRADAKHTTAPIGSHTLEARFTRVNSADPILVSNQTTLTIVANPTQQNCSTFRSLLDCTSKCNSSSACEAQCAILANTCSPATPPTQTTSPQATTNCPILDTNATYVCSVNSPGDGYSRIYLPGQLANCLPTEGCWRRPLAPTPTPTSTPTPAPGATQLALIVSQRELISSPANRSKQVTVVLTPENDQPITKNGTLNYTNGIFFGGNINLGVIPSGNYKLKVKAGNFFKSPITNITIAGTSVAATVPIVVGLTDQDGIDAISAFNGLKSCFGSSLGVKKCDRPEDIDMNSDGNVNVIDYQIYLREILRIRQGAILQ